MAIIRSILEKSQATDFKPITYEAKPDPELIIKSVLKHFTYLKFRNSFRGIDNYNFAFSQPWSHHALFVMENMGIMDYMANVLDTDLEQYVVPRIDSDVLSNPKFDVLKFGCISDPGVRTFVTKLHEVVMNSSKKIGRDETLTDTLVDDLLRVAKFNAFPLMIRNKPRYELYVGDYCVVAKPEFLIKSQDNVLVAVEEKHLDIVRPSSGFGEPQLAIEILSSGSENSRTYYDEKLGYFKDQTVFAIRVISTYVTFYKAMIPAKYWNELEKGYPEEQSIEILRWPARDLKDSGFDLAEPDGRKKVLPSLINIRQSLLQSIRNNSKIIPC
ncbi:hypothetical protein C2G38_2035906 [Gigaspora rosea]|uniref:Restriction endonuclease domain-containing protein n=1 Tax=Gigaspora rosea TaxID=44941 RepID=A0A397VB08_9GLOM|nr:hypothetical protein C2G38_2035906 [Gigaspora rosea]